MAEETPEQVEEIVNGLVFRIKGQCSDAGADMLRPYVAGIERIRANWPHIELVQGGKVADPGAPTCLRCKIEELIRG